MKPSPTSPITLKGTNFDDDLSKSLDLLKSSLHKLQLESARPTIWTAKQVDFLGELYNAIAHVQQALTAMADRARDD